MPAVSKAQQRLMAIAKHHPEQVHARNRGVLQMRVKTLGEIASTPHKGLPARVRKKG